MKDYEVKFDPDLQNYTLDFSDRFRAIALGVSKMETEFASDLIKQRLIELGWEPPKDEENNND